MMRGLLKGRRQLQHLIRVFAGRSFHGGKPRAARGQRSCLVEKDRVHARQRFERSAALDENAVAGARETPAMNATGAARMRGQGVDATSTASPLIGSTDIIQARP